MTTPKGIALLAAGVLALGIVLAHAVNSSEPALDTTPSPTTRRIEHVPADQPWGHDQLRAPPIRVARTAAAPMPTVSKPLATLRDLPPPPEHAEPPALPPEATARR